MCSHCSTYKNPNSFKLTVRHNPSQKGIQIHPFQSYKKGTIDTSTTNDFDSILMILIQFTSASLSSGGKSGLDLMSRLHVLEATWIFFWRTSVARCLSSGGNNTVI